MPTRPQRVVVVGGGAGGFAAAFCAARLGALVTVIERDQQLGGTAVTGGVCHWEPGVGGTGIAHDIYRALRRRRQAGIYGLGRHCCAEQAELRDYPGGEHPLVPGRGYHHTLRRCGTPRGAGYPYAWGRRHWFGVSFTPAAMATTMHRMARGAGCRLMLGRSVDSVRRASDAVTDVVLDQGDVIPADWLIDATGSAHIAALAGCERRSGREAQADFSEPSAPPLASTQRNGVTVMLRVTPRHHEGRDPLDASIPPQCWWREHFPAISAVELPDRSWSINMLPSMDGCEALALGEAAARHECLRRAQACWHHLQTRVPAFRRMQLCAVAPRLGIREAERVIARYTLTEHDLHRPCNAHDDVIAVGDHPPDTHGHQAAHGELAAPYGIPLRCLQSPYHTNLLIASSAAGFSAIAASSARLTRSVMQLGQAAGTACALARAPGRLPCVLVVQRSLAAQGVVL
ncbi:MAG: FAD-dependent oxidoreductase [Planctomycetota bacterium]|jgi:2-polyprenyl-6-methoxyphenol hydroxylase-like FAD-dependent oxidoreductase|nr:FAD-dependent oxidoreductase [Planctomycetota bacterium]